MLGIFIFLWVAFAIGHANQQEVSSRSSDIEDCVSEVDSKMRDIQYSAENAYDYDYETMQTALMEIADMARTPYECLHL